MGEALIEIRRHIDVVYLELIGLEFQGLMDDFVDIGVLLFDLMLPCETQQVLDDLLAPQGGVIDLSFSFSSFVVS